ALLGVAEQSECSERFLRLVFALIPRLARFNGINALRALRRIEFVVFRFQWMLPNWPVLIYFRRQRVFTPPPVRSARPQVCGWSASINNMPATQVEML